MKEVWKNPFSSVPDPSGVIDVLGGLGGKIIIQDDHRIELKKEIETFESMIKECKESGALFVALVGKKKDLLYGMRYKDIKRIIEAEAGIPVFIIELRSAYPYEEGAEKAWLALFEAFTEPSFGMEENKLGVIGMLSSKENMEKNDKKEIIRYGIDGGIEAIKQAGSVTKNIVTAPAALKAARYLNRRFGTPYEVRLPLKMEEKDILF